MASEHTKSPAKQVELEPRRDLPSSPASSKPISAPFLSDGPESVRDSHC
jgi:hypothetical protein